MVEPTSKPSYRLPVGLLHIWARNEDVLERLKEDTAERPGYRLIRPDLLAALPIRRDADVIGGVIAAGRRILDSFAGATTAKAGPSQVRMLIRPAELDLSPQGVKLLPDRIFNDLRETPPPFAGGSIHLTSRAALNLETHYELTQGPPFQRTSGRVVATLIAGRPRSTSSPWRNREIWGRDVRWIRRPEEEALADLIETKSFRVTGAIGVGKTRAVIHSLSQRSRPWIRVTPAYPRGHKKPIEIALLQELQRRLPISESTTRDEIGAYLQGDPSWGDLEPSLSLLLSALGAYGRAASDQIAVVCDSLERAMSADWEAVARLAAAADTGVFQLVLCGRNGTPWLPSLERLPVLEIPPLGSGASEKIIDTLLTGLTLPKVVRQRLLDAGGGAPFALEEGIVRLIQRQQIRRFFGTFVFKGSENATYLPSPRWVRHIEAEAHRIGDPFALRLLAPVDTPVPAGEVSSAASLLGQKVEPGWEKPFLRAGWLRAGSGPWGEGVELAEGAIRVALDSTLAPESREQFHRRLGEILSVLGGGGEGLWQTYHLLEGDPDAIPILLQVASDKRRVKHADGLVDALLQELKNHRDRGGDERTELDLLWRLLPAARHDDRLGDLSAELERAIELAEGQPQKLLALATLRADHQQKDGRFRAAEETLQQALQLAGSTDEPQKAMLLVQLGRLLIRQERNEEAIRLFERILPMLERLDLQSLIASCYFYLGNIALGENRAEDSFELHQRALEHRRPLKIPKAVSTSLSALGSVSVARGRYRQALDFYAEAEQAARAIEEPAELGYVLLGMGRTLNRLGDPGAAAAPLRQCLEIRSRLKDSVGEALAELAVASNYLSLDNPSKAQEHARRAFFRLRVVSEPTYLGEAERLLGRIRLVQRRLDEAQQHFENALQKHLDGGDPLGAAYDRAWLIRTALENAETGDLRILVNETSSFLDSNLYPEFGERIDFEIFRALERLSEGENGDEGRLSYLQRAHKALMQKTSFLDSEQRNRFLLQIPENAAILAAATRYGL